ncbi:DUF4403 family protein [Mesorhizobium sp. M0959]|uniref:DUF4403 family protein n=1 Tax=Mesorhizobium sp. M0959 TaxID=2957034 RepID=UPI00333C3479
MSFFLTSMTKSKGSIAMAAIAAVAVIGGGVWWFQTKSRAVPPQTQAAVGNSANASTIVLPIKASLAEIQTRLNKEIPGTLYSVNEPRDACVPAGWIDKCILYAPFSSRCIQRLKTKISPAIDCHVDGSVTRGTIQVTGSGQTLNLSVPIAVNVTVKGRGEIGRHIQETANGNATVTAAVQADIDEDWNPKATVTPDYHWDKSIGVDVLGFRITFADKVDPKIKDALADLQGKLPGMLQDFKLKERVAKGWDKGFTAIKVNSAPDVWLRFAPKTVGYKGYEVADGVIRLSLMAGGDAETFVGAKPADPAKVPLPPLVKDLPAAGFEFNLPISLDYAALETEAEKALKVNEKQVMDVPNFGKVDVTFTDVKIYQTTGNLLAIGVSIAADPPTSFLDTKGTIWLTGSVKIDNDAKRLSIDKLDVFGKTDSDTVDLLVSIVSIAPVNKAVRDAVSRDYSKDYEKSITEANKALNMQINDDLYFNGKLDSVAANSVSAGPTSVLVNLTAKGSGELGFGKMPSE